MKRRLQVLIIVLVILGYFLLYSVVSIVMAAVGLLITVIVFISVGFWMAFVDKEIKGWERILLIGMFLGFCLFLCSSFLFYVDVAMEMPGWKQANPTIVNNELVKAEWMFILAIILLAAIPVFILILRRESVVRWMNKLSARGIEILNLQLN